MKQYRVTTKFETRYPREVFNKVEYTTDFEAALGAYIIYIQDPETVFCTVDVTDETLQSLKIIAAFNTK